MPCPLSRLLTHTYSVLQRYVSHMLMAADWNEFNMKCFASEDKLIAWFPVLLCAVLVLWPLATLGKAIDCISEVEHPVHGFSSSN